MRCWSWCRASPLKEGVVAIGEIGYDEISTAEERVYQWQLEFAQKNDMVVMVHSPHRDKKRGIVRSLDVAREVGVPMQKLIIDHNNEETVEDVLEPVPGRPSRSTRTPRWAPSAWPRSSSAMVPSD